ncbi:MAG TPA: DUF4382 domain-containing protein [Gemmatimonadales bacterium]|jgi:hypothetical protein
MPRFELALGLTSALLLLSCSTAETGPQSPPDGQTSVFLTDAPFPFDQVARVDVYIESIALAVSADTSESGPPWVTVATPNRTFNLLDLQNGATALLGGAVVPEGQYRAARVIIDPDRSSITDNDGHVFASTTIPGTPGINWQAKGEDPSLFALVEEPMAVDQNGADIVIDFDVGRSFLYDGNGGFTFIPWLRAITRSGSGNIAGVVRRADGGTPIPNAAVNIRVALDSGATPGPVVATSRAGADGHFTASFLRPGRYQVQAEDLASQAASEVKQAEVRAGRTVDLGALEIQ